MAVKATTIPEIISAIPHTLGFMPEESITLLLFRGKSSGAALRIDLPVTPNSGLPDAIHGYLANAEVDGFFICIFTKNPAGRYDKLEDLAWAVTERLQAAGMDHKGSAMLTDAEWVDMIGGASGPALEVEFNSVTVHMAANGVEPRREVAIPEYEGTSYYDGAIERAVASVREKFEDHRVGVERTRNIFRGLLSGAYVTRTATRAELVRIIAAMQYGMSRDNLLCTVLKDAPIEREDFQPLMLGKMDAAVDYSEERCKLAEQVLLDALVLTRKPEYRANLLCGLGWISWIKGMGTPATRLLDAALAENPTHRLSILMKEMIFRGHLAETSMDKSNWKAS